MAEKLHPAMVNVIEHARAYSGALTDIETDVTAAMVEAAGLTAQRELMAEGVRKFAESARRNARGILAGTSMTQRWESTAVIADLFADRLERSEGDPE